MNNNSRIKNSLINLTGAIINQVTLILLTFISRTIFIKVLGVEYLGLSGLYTNIITIFSLAELGLSTSILYLLYKPVAENNQEKLNSLIKFFSQIYKYIIIVILIGSLILMPFLPFIIKTTISSQECLIYYLLFVVDTVFSYLFMYKILLLNADQRNYIVTNTSTIIIIIKSILQIFLLLYYKSYTLYLIIQIISTLSNNLILSFIANKKYPFLKDKSQELTITEKKEVKKNIESQFIYKFSNVLLNGTDYILISILVSTECVGYYSNYNVIVATVNTIITLLFTALMGSLGNFIAKENKEKMTAMFKIFNFIGNYLGTICSVLLLFLLNDFITLWLGNSFILDTNVLLIIVGNFYLQTVLQPINSFRNTTGLFNETKYIMPVAAALNILLSIIFGLWWGLFGILFASFIARFVTVFWFEPKVLFKKFKDYNLQKYFFNQTTEFVILIVIVFIINFISKNLTLTWFYFILKALIIFLIANVIILILNFRKKEFKDLTNTLFRKVN